jgi:hypothetical protein
MVAHHAASSHSPSVRYFRMRAAEWAAACRCTAAVCDDIDVLQSSMLTPKLTNEIITAAIDGFEAQKTRIDQQISELRAMLPGGPPKDGSGPELPKAATRPKRRMSAAGRRAIAEAQRKRWAAARGEAQSEAPAPEPTKPKRQLSAQGRKAIADATRRRWAMKRAEAAKTRFVCPPPTLRSDRGSVRSGSLAIARSCGDFPTQCAAAWLALGQDVPQCGHGRGVQGRPPRKLFREIRSLIWRIRSPNGQRLLWRHGWAPTRRVESRQGRSRTFG